ncbi:hypothetical protein MKW92_020587, partial [Papaver armeniacum]
AAKEELDNKPKMKRGQAREGIARCTFEDRILSDTIFLRAWTQVEVPRLFHPLATALQPQRCGESIISLFLLTRILST